MKIIGTVLAAATLYLTAPVTAAPGPLFSAVLPTSRSVQVGQPATAFATILNAGSDSAAGCRIAPLTSVAATFFYQATDPATNALTGTVNTPVTIAAGAGQSFAFGFTPTAPIAPTVVQLQFVCDNASPAATVNGLNTLIFVADTNPVPDIVALSATLANDGVMRATPLGVFAVAVSNVGASGTIDVSTDTGTTVLPLTIALCQTDPASSNCINPPAPTTGHVTLSIAGGATPTFGVFVTRSAPFPFDPANNRIFVRFRDNAGGVDRGATSVAVDGHLPARSSTVAAGGAHTCALRDNGAAYCWGRGESGQLGAPAASSCTLNAVAFPCALIPVEVGGGLSFTQITGGGAHTCALTAAGIAYCWGNNESGQLGDNSTTQRDEPVVVAAVLQFDIIDAGANHTCGLTAGGAAYCWGRNDRGQLGDGTDVNRLVPVAVTGGLSFEIVTAGGLDIGHTCGFVAGGVAYCWGDNERGQLGIGTTDLAPHPAPVPVDGGLTFVSLTAGLGHHTCALTDVGAAYCWGENTFGALGDGSMMDTSSPVVVSGGFVLDQLIAGGFIGHTCGLTEAGAAYCWGENERGQVGDGSTTDRLTPSAVTGGFEFASLDAGFRHTCALTVPLPTSTSGTLYCWGSGAAGQLGTNSTSQSNVPAKVFGQP